MTNIKKITRNSVADQVYRQLRDNILEKKWQPGDKIPSENQLVSLFGVSRASIRMAIQKMITLGLLESRVGNGTYVREFSPHEYINELAPLILNPEDQLEIMEFRKALETEALKLAAVRSSDEEVRELKDINVRARKAFMALDLETYFKEDMQFHMQIFRMSRNRIFISTIQTLSGVLFPHFYSVAKDFFETYEVPSEEDDMHSVIVKALENRDSKTCVRAYTKMIEDLISMYNKIQKNDAPRGKG
jgi:GntR family transcriptional repressor for pyruvate dehydrogenase complex